MKLKYLLIIAISFLMMPLVGFAHPGRTDSSGCHTCKTNCSNWGLSYGEYHCHRAKALPQPEEPIKSHFGENGSGYTEPAPEYKAPTPIINPTPISNPIPSSQIKVSSPKPLSQENKQKEQKIENKEIKPSLQQASVNEVVKEKPKTNVWKKLLKFFGWIK